MIPARSDRHHDDAVGALRSILGASGPAGSRSNGNLKRPGTCFLGYGQRNLATSSEGSRTEHHGQQGNRQRGLCRFHGDTNMETG